MVTATSTDPLSQPFVRDQVFLPVWAHEPDAIWGPDDEVVIMVTRATALEPITGGPGPGGPVCTTCSDGSTAKGCVSRNPFSPPDKYGKAMPTQMSYSHTASEQFTDPVTLFNASAGLPCRTAWWMPTPRSLKTWADTNLAGVILPNGTFVGIWRECSQTPPSSKTIHPVRASNWSDPKSYHWDTAPLFGDGPWGVGVDHPPPEDPFVWGPDVGGVFHALFHDKSCSGCGSHGFSTDGRVWQYTGIAYNATVIYDDGTVHTFAKRERPHLVFNGTEPIALTNGAMHSATSDATTTLLQPLGRGASM